MVMVTSKTGSSLQGEGYAQLRGRERPKIFASIYSYINPRVYYQQTSVLSADNFGNFYLGNETSYGDWDLILGSHIFHLAHSDIAIFKFKLLVFNNLKIDFSKLLVFNNLSDVLNTMQPKLEVEVVGVPNPNPSNNKKILLSNFEYNLLNKHAEYSDQHMGAVHLSLCNKDFFMCQTKLIKNNTSNKFFHFYK